MNTGGGKSLSVLRGFLYRSADLAQMITTVAQARSSPTEPFSHAATVFSNTFGKRFPHPIWQVVGPYGISFGVPPLSVEQPYLI